MSEWISVNDRFPKETGKFMCKMEIGSANIIIVERPAIFKIDENGGRFFAGDWAQVTHWQPLPEPPK